MLERIEGTTQGGRRRLMDCSSEDGRRLHLWIHSPDSETNGWEIFIDPHELFASLDRLGIRPASER